ncbi:hypothetical protein ACA910_015581 [Epithemia clementina (nom. ined.)]
MMDSVIRGDRRVKWTHIMQYLDANTFTDHDHQVPLPFDSPLPPYCHAKKELAKELAPCPKSGDSLLRRAVLGGGPQRIVACLCHLAPKALTVQDSKGRVLLHLATRVPVTPSSEAVLKLILQAHPAALITRDSYGRTPLHWLLWYHCADRQPEVVFDFCRTLSKQKFNALVPSHLSDTVVQDKNFLLPAVPRPQSSKGNGTDQSTASKVPPTAAILPDAVYGCLPLHYAVANGASLEVLRVLLLAYPLSKHVTDRYGRTAAHWYLGAGQVVFGGNHHHPQNNNNNNNAAAFLLHISGEPPNPNATPWHKTPLDPDKLSLVLSSRVARTMDGMGRNPLHWACFTLAYAIYHSSSVVDPQNHVSLQQQLSNGKDTVDCEALPYMSVVQAYIPVLKLLMDAHANQILGTDEEGQTPLVVLLDTLLTLQQQDPRPLPLPHPILGGFQDSTTTSCCRIGLEFSPVLLKMLMEHPDSNRGAVETSSSNRGKQRGGDRNQPSSSLLFPASIEDSKGRLPLHVAAAIGCGVQTMSILVQAHPTGLVHTTDNYQSPLHMALSNPHVAPYWTSAAMNVFLRPYHTGPSQSGHLHGGPGSVFVDGRMALKMEDINGVYPIHYATQNNASLRVLEALLQAYPAVALQIRHDTQDLAFFHLLPNHMMTTANEDGEGHDTAADTKKESEPKDANPLHNNSYAKRFQTIMHDLLRGQQSSQSPPSTSETTTTTTETTTTSAFKEVLSVLKQKMQLFVPLLLQDAEASNNSIILQRMDSRHNMHILHVAVLFQGATYPQLAQLLKLCPDSAKHICNCLQDPPPPADQLPHETSNLGQESPAVPPPPEWTVLDLHEAVQPHWLGRSMDEWHYIRQLLFAHYPMVSTHRYRQELLSQCVRIVIQEVAYHPKLTEDEYRPDNDPTLHSSFHWHALQEAESEENKEPHLEISHSLSAVESSVRQTLNIRQPPLPVAPVSRPPGTRMKGGPKNGIVAPKQTQQQQPKKSILASVREMSSRRSSRRRAKTRSSKYDEDDTKYDAAMSEYDDEDESEEDSMSSFSQRDDDGSSTSGDDDDEGSYTTDAYTDTEGETTDRAFSTDENSFSTNHPSRTFSSEADSSHWSPRSSMDTAEQRFNRRNNNNKSKVQQPSGADAFDRALRRGEVSGSESMEEKKDDNNDPTSPVSRGSPRRKQEDKSLSKNAQGIQRFAHRPKYMSEVGMRIWTFFALYCDVNNPNDTYVHQIAAIFGEIPFSKVEQLVQLPLPSYAVDYLPLEEIFVGRGELQAFRDVASPKCRELIHKTCFFVGMYEFTLQTDSKQAAGIKAPKYGSCFVEPSLVYCRPDDRHSFSVRALEWTFTTQEATDAATTPGLSEEEIWQTGVMPAETGVTFRSRRRPVVINFTQDLAEYENERECRSALLPDQDDVTALLAYYNATQQERQVDRHYRTDINDDRFNRLAVGRDRVFMLQNYAFAFVYNAADSLDNVLATFGGLESTEDVKKLCFQVGHALKNIHSRNVVHGNLSMRNVVQEHGSVEKRWALRDFSCGSHSSTGQFQRRLGRVSSEGRCLFATSTLPPEMFVQLSEMELQAYERYWLFVEKTFFVKVDRSAIDPLVDPDTGDTFVPRCHFTPPENSTVELPPLPYSLVRASPATDYWAYGLLIFEVCTGRPLFATEPRSGRLLEYHRHANWSSKVAASLIYNIVKNPIHQDLFLQLLSPVSMRSELTLDKILSHPFFGDKDAQSSTTVKNMIETRRRDTLAHKRLLQKKLHETSETGWLAERTTRLDCWDFAVLAKFQESAASVVGRMTTHTDDALSFPSSFIVLPYRLSLDEASQLTADNVGKAVETGVCLLRLCKTCYFAAQLGRAIKNVTTEAAGRKISMSDVINRLNLPRDDFSEAIQKCSELASHHVELFREKPWFVIQKILQGALDQFFELFQEGDAWLYLVDEFNYLPVLDGFWKADSSHRDDIIRRSVLSTIVSCLCSWRTAGHMSGFTKLVNEAFCSETPQEWLDVARGLDPTDYGNDLVVIEISILQDALSDMTQNRHTLGDNDLPFLRDYLSTLDPKRQLGDLCRVMVSSKVGLWTTKRQCQRLEAQCQKFSMQDALQRYAATLPVDP